MQIQPPTSLVLADRPLELAERAPERVNSILMLAAIGVQEHETFGQYDLNHGVHGLHGMEP